MTARLDRSTGRLEVSVALHRPFPLALDRSYWYSGTTVSVNGAPSAAGDCRTGSDTVGATWLFIEPEQPNHHPNRRAAANAARANARCCTVTGLETRQAMRDARKPVTRLAGKRERTPAVIRP